MRQRLDHDGGAVAQDLGKARHEFGGVVVHRNDGIRAVLLRVLAHKAIGIRAGSLAKVGVDGDVAAKQRLQAAKEIADYRARSDGDAANDPKVADNPVAMAARAP